MSSADVMVLDFLDWYRGVAQHKLAGLTRVESTSVATPSRVTALGIVNHLAWDERGWFGHFFLGRDNAGEVDTDESFQPSPDDTVESVIDDYRREITDAQHVVDNALSMDAQAVLPHPVFGSVDLRWIVVHMLEETARHVGHLDILTELTDGRVGD